MYLLYLFLYLKTIEYIVYLGILRSIDVISGRIESCMNNILSYHLLNLYCNTVSLNYLLAIALYRVLSFTVASRQFLSSRTAISVNDDTTRPHTAELGSTNYYRISERS